ncbi:MAG TPA: cysteine desulfurase family protein [Ignavibacteria bacterium]
MEKIYFDNASTTPTAPEVIEAMNIFHKEKYGNASSVHSFGKSSKVLLEETRDLLASFIGAKPKEIFFTSGGTESNNMAIKGLAFKNLHSNKKHIISSSIEHSAVFETLNYLSENFGFKVTFVKPDKSGFIDIRKIENEINPDTFLISIMHSNNETGAINDVFKILKLAHINNIAFHSDTVQSIGKTAFNIKDLGVDFATISAHKFFGPKGIGALYINETIKIDNLIHGGPQERNLRAGTENIPAIAGLKAAIELLNRNYEKDIHNYKTMNSVLTLKLKEHFGKNVSFNSPLENSLPNIVNISFDPQEFNFDPEMLLIMLDLRSIAVSVGSACTSGASKPSRVLLELGKSRTAALASLRISFGRYNTLQEIERFMEVIKEVII